MTDIRDTRPGRPGASAQRVYEQRLREAEAWRVGAAGERTVARRLGRTRRVIVLSDRAWPGRRANLDHVVVASSGVFVIDTKAYGGRVGLIDRGSFCRPLLRLQGPPLSVQLSRPSPASPFMPKLWDKAKASQAPGTVSTMIDQHPARSSS